jgi:hypothetical protein
MSVVIIQYEARCKHCRFFNYSNLTKKDGDKSKIKRAFCTNPISVRFTEQLTLKHKACDKLEL